MSYRIRNRSCDIRIPMSEVHILIRNRNHSYRR